MTKKSTALDRIASRVDLAKKSSTAAAELLALPLTNASAMTVKRETDKAKQTAGSALLILRDEGALIPPLPPSQDLLDSPANHAYLAALDAAVLASDVVDEERGFSMPESDRLSLGDTLGVDLAADINQILARVRLKVFGPAGREAQGGVSHE